ncbi:hypothetical protein MASR2M66_11000 [Chloroflexota bacterium]|nr:hypothetical protein [Anaerolineales bacterium]
MKPLANPHKISNLILGVVLICVGICCASLTKIFSPQPAPKYGKEFNLERSKRGIPIIPENWDYFYSADIVKWSDPDSYWKLDEDWGSKENPRPPIYYQKQVVIIDDNKLKETDAYLGSDIYEVKGDVAIPERVLITCIYHVDDVKDLSCSAEVYTHEITFTNGSVNTAKDILKKWGLSYP